MKVMFLDIDGVLCTLRSQYAFGDQLLMQSWDPTCCQMIRRLCKYNDYKIVCSSTWRTNKHTKYYFGVYGLIDYLHDDWKTPTGGKIRGDEVESWLSDHSDSVTKYVIVDDDRDFYDYQKDRLIFVDDNYDGFSSKNFQLADKLMGDGFHDKWMARPKQINVGDFL